MNHEFRKEFATLVIRCFKPAPSLTEGSFRESLTQMSKIVKKRYWQEASRYDKLIVHAETLCQALSYREVVKVLAKQASRDNSRGDIYWRYLKLVEPRLAAIYQDWKSA